MNVTTNTITVVSLCKDKLHEREYVDPLVAILKAKHKVNVVRLDKMSGPISTSIILSGTALQDNEYLNHLEKLAWLKAHPYSILGICAGMQVLSVIYGGAIVDEQRIGTHDVNNISDKLLHSVTQAYFLHQHSTHLSDTLRPIAYGGKVPVAFKHVNLPHYGVLFHPEVRNEQIIEQFGDL